MQGLAREIIFAIGDNMTQGLEPLLTKTLAPSLYQVYLHADDYDRLRTIFVQIEAEARIHLDRRLRELESRAKPGERSLGRSVRDRLPRLPRGLRQGREPTPSQDMRYEPADGQWHIRFQEDPNGDLEPGEVEVVSEMAVGELVEYGSGSPTEKIKISTTRKLGSSSTTRGTASGASSPGASERPTQPVAAGPTPVPSPPAQGAAEPSAEVVAQLEYDELGEAKTFELKSDRDLVVIGRGAIDVWVDLRLRTLSDVSRRHTQIRRDANGGFWIQDLSQYGTSVDGRPVPSDREVELSDGALIDLASVAQLRFRRRVAVAVGLPPLPPPPSPMEKT